MNIILYLLVLSPLTLHVGQDYESYDYLRSRVKWFELTLQLIPHDLPLSMGVYRSTNRWWHRGHRTKVLKWLEIWYAIYWKVDNKNICGNFWTWKLFEIRLTDSNWRMHSATQHIAPNPLKARILTSAGTNWIGDVCRPGIYPPRLPLQ